MLLLNPKDINMYFSKVENVKNYKTIKIIKW